MKRGKKRLNTKLERHMAESRALKHEVSTYIYIYILNLRFFILAIMKQCVSFNNPQHFHLSISPWGLI